MRITNVFLGYLLECLFSRSQSISPPRKPIQYWARIWIFCGGADLTQSGPTPVSLPLSFAFALLVHFLLWDLSLSYHIFHGFKHCLVDCVDLISAACTTDGKVLGSLFGHIIAWVSIVVLFPTSVYESSPRGLLLSALKALGLS